MNRRFFITLFSGFMTRPALTFFKKKENAMSFTLHKADTRGIANHGWLKSHHTFSFASYYNPERMGFGALRVINDDQVAPTMGFGTHPHQNMEIISIPLSGSLEHKDTMGNEYVIRRGEVQAMSAGTGIAHSEYNHSSSEDVKFLQIWVLPKKLNITPQYSQKEFLEKERENKFQLVVSPDGRNGSVSINQDAFFSLVNLKKDSHIEYNKYIESNGVYFFVLEGELEVDNKLISSRDGLGVSNKDGLNLNSSKDTQLLVMEVPMNV